MRDFEVDAGEKRCVDRGLLLAQTCPSDSRVISRVEAIGSMPDCATMSDRSGVSAAACIQRPMMIKAMPMIRNA
ncbi:hypothetical protein [Tateyamaria sp. SN3-11]|uniref:hypothetical protein n=1 Tax=Tateyamaria sp. SN3-11 TaxID=3092147 RepID=UPI0039ECEA5C